MAIDIDWNVEQLVEGSWLPVHVDCFALDCDNPFHMPETKSSAGVALIYGLSDGTKLPGADGLPADSCNEIRLTVEPSLARHVAASELLAFDWSMRAPNGEWEGPLWVAWDYIAAFVLGLYRQADGDLNSVRVVYWLLI